jgi:two-component system NtrC family sensor kinase
VFDEHDLELLEAMVGSAVTAIENARLYQAEREQYNRLQASQARLIQAEKMEALGRLIASIAHEINNPLQAVLGCLELFREELDDHARREKLQRYLGIVETETERIATIVRRVRDFYRPARREMQPTDVHVVLGGVLELAGKQLQHHNIVTEREWAEDLPLIQANSDHLKQVFLNLVLNAIDAIPERGGTLRIRTASDQMSGADNRLLPAVRVEFSDTGAGMSPEVVAHLFEPFFTTKTGGTGLGLAVSYEIIQAHSGQISVKSQKGIGTTFTILLPVERP